MNKEENPKMVNVSTQTIRPYYSTISWFTVFTPLLISIIAAFLGLIFLEFIKKVGYLPSTEDMLLQLIPPAVCMIGQNLTIYLTGLKILEKDTKKINKRYELCFYILIFLLYFPVDMNKRIDTKIDDIDYRILIFVFRTYNHMYRTAPLHEIILDSISCSLMAMQGPK